MTCVVLVPNESINIAISIARKYKVLVDILYDDDLYTHIELIGSKKNLEKVLENISFL